MRGFLVCVVLAACGPKPAPRPAFDEDLGPKPAAEPAATGDAATAPAPERPVAPAGKGLRTGTIERAKLVDVLDHGPGAFLRQLEVTARMDGDRFVGWQLVQLVDHASALVDVDVAPGDILLAINGKPLSRPDQLQAVWDSLRTANTLVADLWRGQTKLRLEFQIEPRL